VVLHLDAVEYTKIRLLILYNSKEKDTAYTKTMLMVVDCTTKPVNGVQLTSQVSYIIGQCFFLAHDLQHYHDLVLDSYAWIRSVKCLSSAPS
jgi:hypothetical protein